MKFSFRKIGSVLASTAMLTSTVALAAAANFPAPFVTSAGADVAIVHGGANAAFTDLVAVADVTSYLSSELASKTAVGAGSSTNPTTEGETVALFSSGTKLYINDTLNSIKSAVTKTELATVLKDGSFSGNVEATYTQTITLGSTPSVRFAKQPTSSEDPLYALTLSTSSGQINYNASASFNKAVNLTHADSKGQELVLFGQKFTIGSATTATDIVLLKSAEKVSLTSDDPSAEVTIGGNTYTLELISTSDTTATVKVTNSAGTSETKEISEAASKKVNGVTIAVDTADETNLKLSASIIAGAEKVTLTDGSSVTIGESTTLDGTIAYLTGGITALTKLTIAVVAPGSDEDALKPGKSFTDPIFGTFKLDFAGLSVPDDSTSTAREDIQILPAGDDKIELKVTDYRGNEKSVQWAKNYSTGMQLQWDSDGHNITVFERGSSLRGDYIVIGNEEEGRLVKVSTITNQTTSYTNDKVKFLDVFSADTYETTLDLEGHGTVTVAGKVYDVNYFGAQSLSEDARSVRVNYPDSSGATTAVIYPTIKSSKGAKIAFYEPTTITLDNWDGAGNGLSTLRFPDGDGYTDVTFALASGGNFTVNSVALNGTTAATATTVAVGRLNYNVTWSGANQTTIYLMTPTSASHITTPALVMFEEKDDNTNYEALVVTLDGGTTSSNGLDVSDVYRTWMASTASGSATFRDSLASDSDITKEADLFGTIVSLDSNTAGHKKAIISYPDNQVEVQMYIGAIASAVTGASTTGTGATVKTLGSVAVTDSEASSVAAKNLVVIGGSCVNSVAAELLGVASPTCGADFTTKTSVGSGQYLIETFSRTGGKVATLVAGYNAGDTTNAAKALTTQTIDTTAGKKYTGTTSSDVTASVASTTGTTV